MEIKNEVKSNPVPQVPVKQFVPPAPVKQPLPPVKPPVPVAKKNIQDPKDEVLIYLRDNVIHGSQRYVDMINRVLVKEGGI